MKKNLNKIAPKRCEKESYMEPIKEYSKDLEFEIDADVAWITGVGVCENEDLIISMVTDDNYKVVGIIGIENANMVLITK